MLLPQIAAAADTMFVRQLPAVRTTFEQVVFVASGLTSILVLLLLVALIIGMVRMRARANELRTQLDALLAELRPMTRNAAAMYEDVREAANDVRAIVDESRDTVKQSGERIRRSVDGLADRVDQVSDLVGRVHDSAENIATVATTAVGGIKLGARAMGLGKRKKRSVPPPERPRLRRKD